jgi:hypothetical protein
MLGICLFAGFTLRARGGIAADTLMTQGDSIPAGKGPFIRNVEFSTDYAKLAALPLKSEDKAEAGAGIFFRNKFGLNFEAGFGNLSPKYAFKNSSYHSEGMYGRVGISYLYEYEQGIRLYAGAKYAESYFSDNGMFTINNPLWNDFTGTFERKDLKAKWAEIVAGSESRWKGNFYLGFIARFRIMIRYPVFEDIGVYSIPGYGITAGSSLPVVNLYIKYLIE